MVKKGKVSTVSVDGKTVMVTPYSGGIVTSPLVVPYFLIGVLPINTPVVYTTFDDNTGIVLARADGDWNHGIVDPGTAVAVLAVVENGVCKLVCESGTSQISVDVVEGVCVASCAISGAIYTGIEDGVCVVKCNNS